MSEFTCDVTGLFVFVKQLQIPLLGGPSQDGVLQPLLPINAVMDSWRSGNGQRLMVLQELGTEWRAICSLQQNSQSVRHVWLADCIVIVEKRPRQLNPSFIVVTGKSYSPHTVDMTRKKRQALLQSYSKSQPYLLYPETYFKKGETILITGSNFLGFSPLKILPNIESSLLQHEMVLSAPCSVETAVHSKQKHSLTERLSINNRMENQRRGKVSILCFYFFSF